MQQKLNGPSRALINGALFGERGSKLTLARVAGVDQSTASRLFKREDAIDAVDPSGATMLHTMALLGECGRTDVIEELLALHGHECRVLPREQVEVHSAQPHDALGTAAEVVAAASDALQQVVDAVRDGRIDRREALKCDRALAAAERELARARATVAAAAEG